MLQLGSNFAINEIETASDRFLRPIVVHLFLLRVYRRCHVTSFRAMVPVRYVQDRDRQADRIQSTDYTTGGWVHQAACGHNH